MAVDVGSICWVCALIGAGSMPTRYGFGDISLAESGRVKGPTCGTPRETVRQACDLLDRDVQFRCFTPLKTTLTNIDSQ